MDPRDPAIFVFADDVLVYASARDAEEHLEPWFEEWVKAVYDEHGNVLRLTAFNRDGGGVTIGPAEPPENRWEELVGRLREHLHAVAEHRPDRLDSQWVERASGGELVRWSVEHETTPGVDRKRQWWRFW